MLHYIYAHTETESTTGYFSCTPEPEPSLPDALAYLAEHPLDSFMRRYLLNRLSQMEAHAIRATFLDQASSSSALLALAEELMTLAPALEGTLTLPVHSEAKATSEDTSLVFLRWRQLPYRNAHRSWNELLSTNIKQHKKLQPQSGLELPLPYIQKDGALFLPEHEVSVPSCFYTPGTTALAELATTFPLPGGIEDAKRPDPADTAALAQERLLACGIIDGQEMRHTASLSPIGLLRPWRVQFAVNNGRHNFSLSGKATTYGRGLSIPAARASCLMEMVERASLYVSIANDEVLHRKDPTPLLYGTPRELQAQGHRLLDLSLLPLDVPYTGSPLWWVAGHAPDHTVTWVPLQLVTLFSNLDETTLMDAVGSTGIATGCTLEDAKLAALAEIIERDAEAVTPFQKSDCFTLTAKNNPQVAMLLQDYKARGIQVQFQKLAGRFGVPAYKCFVMSMRGAIARGHGAGLSGARAVLSAMTETPYPYPNTQPSGPTLRGIPEIDLADLPEYSTGSAKADLALLEALLSCNGLQPVYVVMTHEKLLFPVVRAIIPGMETSADTDGFSRLAPRLYSRYLALQDA